MGNYGLARMGLSGLGLGSSGIIVRPRHALATPLPRWGTGDGGRNHVFIVPGTS